MGQVTVTMPDEAIELLENEAQSNPFINSKSEAVRRAVEEVYGEGFREK